MEERNCEILFEYLRGILYDSRVQEPDIASLDEPYRKLGMGLKYLNVAVQEMKSYSAALSKGNLSVAVPGRENFLCENLKNIHANLNHLTWQAKQVAKGDYSQNVSYLGEFSEAFNTMTKQLYEREMVLKQEAEHEKEHAQVMESYNELLAELIERSEEDVLVTSAEGEKILYCNEMKATERHEIYKVCLAQGKMNAERRRRQDESYDWVWEAEDSKKRYYKIFTVYMEWQGEKAFAHIIREVTAEKKHEEELELEVYRDMLTGIGNRRMFREHAAKLLDSGEHLVFCYCDLDHLKYVNDEYGHSEGDWYLKYFVATVKHDIRKNDIFVRLGGDEFCIILQKCSKRKAQEKFAVILQNFAEQEIRPYPKSFSYGIVEVEKGHGEIPLEKIIEKADSVMYEQKRCHKEAYMKELQNSLKNIL